MFVLSCGGKQINNNKKKACVACQKGAEKENTQREQTPASWVGHEVILIIINDSKIQLWFMALERAMHWAVLLKEHVCFPSTVWTGIVKQWIFWKAQKDLLVLFQCQQRPSVLPGSHTGAVCSRCLLQTVLAEFPKCMWLNLHVRTCRSAASCNFATYGPWDYFLHVFCTRTSPSGCNTSS